MKPADTFALEPTPSVTSGFCDLTAADYHADPVEPCSLSSSIAWTLVNKSPLHAWSEHPKLGKTVKLPTNEMDFGDVCHELFLGKGGGFSVWSGDSWRGKDASAFWDAALANGKTPIKESDHGRAVLAVAAWKAQLPVFELDYVLSEGISEQVVIWNEGGVKCRAMLDRWLPNRAEIVDLKTMSESAHPRACAARIASMGYDMRSEFYKAGVTAVTLATADEETQKRILGRLKFLFIFAETKPPFSITPIRLNGEWNTIAQSKCARAIKTWGECLAANKWPSYTSKVETVEPPAWALPAEIAAS